MLTEGCGTLQFNLMKHQGVCLSKQHEVRERELIKYKSTYQFSIFNLLPCSVLSSDWLLVSMTSTSTRSRRMYAQQAQRPCGKSAIYTKTCSLETHHHHAIYVHACSHTILYSPVHSTGFVISPPVHFALWTTFFPLSGLA